MRIIRAPTNYFKRSTVTVTFDGTAGKGAVGAVPVFTVTGEVLVAAFSVIGLVNLTEALATATLILGVTGATNLFIPSTNATTITAGKFWVSATATANGIALPAAMKDIVITDNVIATVGAQAVNGGSLRFDMYWLPLSADGAVA